MEPCVSSGSLGVIKIGQTPESFSAFLSGNLIAPFYMLCSDAVLTESLSHLNQSHVHKGGVPLNLQTKLNKPLIK